MRIQIPCLIALLTAGLQAQAPRVTAPPEALLARVEAKHRAAVRAFYRKSVDIQGLPVLASGNVSDEALLRTHELVSHVLAGRPDVIRAMAEFGTRLLIIGRDEVYTDLPEYRDTPDPAFWNERVRGTGGDDRIAGGAAQAFGPLFALQHAKREFRRKGVLGLFGRQGGVGRHDCRHSRSFSRLRRSQVRIVFSGTSKRAASSV